MKEQDKTPEEKLSKVETVNLLKKQFRGTILKMMEELGRRMYAQREKLEAFNKELEILRNNQTEMKNTVTENINQKESTE